MKFVLISLVIALCALAIGCTEADAGEKKTQISPVQKTDTCIQKTCVQKTATQKSIVPGDGTIPLKYKLTLRSRLELRREARSKIRGLRIQTGRVSVCIGGTCR